MATGDRSEVDKCNEGCVKMISVQPPYMHDFRVCFIKRVCSILDTEEIRRELRSDNLPIGDKDI